MKLTLVAPCYNEQENVKEFYRAVKDVFDDRYEYQVVFVDDGSRDKTYEKLKELVDEENGNIKVIHFSRNFGKESAIYAGLEAAEGDYVAVIDSDLQQPPEVVSDMVDYLDAHSDFDCVAAYQDRRSESKTLIKCKNAFYDVINGLSDTKFVKGASDFRTMKRSMVEAVLSLAETQRFSKGLFSWVGFNVHYIPYEARLRHAGTSSWSFKKLFRYAIDGIMDFSVKPLNWVFSIGVFFTAVSVIYLILGNILKFSVGLAIPSASLWFAAVLGVIGIQTLCLGVIAKYIAKIYMEGKHRPIYIAKETIEKNKK